MHDELQYKAKSQSKAITSRLYSLLCPCLIHNDTEESLEGQSSSYHEETNSHFPESVNKSAKILTDINSKDRNDTSENLRVGTGLGEKEKNPKLLKSLTEISDKSEDHVSNKTIANVWHSYSIEKYKENEIFPIGNSKARLLAKISTIRTEPSSSSKKSFLNSKTSHQSEAYYGETNLDKYWNKRYFMFEKFDEGISINEESWPNIIPEAVSEHISSQIKCDIVFDIFCGVGCNSLKLANTCKKVISIDNKMENLKCLQKNKQIYEKENIEVFYKEEYKSIKYEPNVILITNNFGLHEKEDQNSVSLQEINQEFIAILQLSLTCCQNVMAILPPNIDIETVGSFISTTVMGNNILTETCCVKIEKVFYGEKLKCIIIYFGEVINNITINEELDWIYEQLIENHKKHFHHKKIIKEIRESIGMTKLLNLIEESNNCICKSSKIDQFLLLLKSKAIITETQYHQLCSYVNCKTLSFPQQQNSPKSTQDEFEIERTNSFFSSVADHQNDSNDPQFENSQNQEIEIIGGSQYQSNSIAGQRSTFSVKSVNLTRFPYPPGRDTFGIKEIEEGSNRESDVVEFMKLNMN